MLQSLEAFRFVLERCCAVNNRELAKLEKRVPERAVAALNAAHQRVIDSRVPHVVVIEDSLYRVSASGARELIRTLTPRTRVPGRAKRTQV